LPSLRSQLAFDELRCAFDFDVLMRIIQKPNDIAVSGFRLGGDDRMARAWAVGRNTAL
jgi:hypothetical protein